MAADRCPTYSPVYDGNFCGFGGRTFRVPMEEYPPFITKTFTTNGTLVWSGISLELLKTLAEVLDFRYETYQVEDGTFGVKNESGMWTGKVGDLYRKKAELAVCLTITDAREEVVDFTVPYWEEPSVVVVRVTQDLSGFLSMFRPLSTWVWVITLLCLLTTAASMWVFSGMSREIRGSVTCRGLSLGYSIYYCYGAFLQRGLQVSSMCVSCKWVVQTWWLVVIIMYATYTGNLMAALAVSQLKLPFTTLADMTAQQTYSYGVEDGIIQQMLFKESKDGIYKEIWEGISSHNRNLVSTLQEGVNRARKENFAFVGEKTALQSAMAQYDDCMLAFLREEFFPGSIGIAVPQGWPYKKYFDKTILKIVEAGLIQQWKHVYFPRQQCSLQTTSLHAKAISLQQAAGPFCVLLAGLLLSVLVLFWELLTRRRPLSFPVNTSCFSPHSNYIIH